VAACLFASVVVEKVEIIELSKKKKNGSRFKGNWGREKDGPCSSSSLVNSK